MGFPSDTSHLGCAVRCKPTPHRTPHPAAHCSHRTCLPPSLEICHLLLSSSGAAFLWLPRACFSEALQGGRQAPH